MLYNVLPPLVFFASLGGTIFVVSRVVTRLHRQSLVTTTRLIAPRDLASLLGPSQKSVHVIKNRLTVVTQFFQQALLQTKGSMIAVRSQLVRKSQTLSVPTIKPPTKYLLKISQTFKASFNRAKNKTKTKVTETPDKSKPTLRMVENDILPKPTPPPSVTMASTSKDSLAKKIFSKKLPVTPLATARQQLSACRYQSAEKTLVPFLAKHPKNIRAYMLLGKAALGRQNWSEASEVFEQVINIKPNTKGCYAALGYANYKAGKLTKALEALQKAHDSDPHNTVVIKRLLSIARRMDNQPLQRSLMAQLADLKTSAKQ